MDENLSEGHCVPCEGGVPKLGSAEIRGRLPLVPGWDLSAEDRLERRFEFEDFAALMKFVDRMAEVAETEGHHPDFCVHYSRLDVSIWTHAIGGLSQNDFILAAKLNRIAEAG